MQAVPLTVTGVDALGRAFQERTSTLIVNCHGCRYQSKHYVLKNMWVTLEVPHPEPGRDPRKVRAKVTWIQRPRTVRELFQIGAELEVPGNVWGIAFAPDDWFPFPEGAAAEVAGVEGEASAVAQSEEWVALSAAAEENNVRVLPMPGADAEASLNLARQMARLMIEAKQQVQTAVREATAKAVAAETQSLLATVQSQFQEAAEKAVRAAATAHADRVISQALARMEEARQAGLEVMRVDWSREAERRVQDSVEQLTALLTKLGEAQRGIFEQQLETKLSAALANLKEMSGEVRASAEGTVASVERSRQEINEAAEMARQRLQEILEGRTGEARSPLEELEKAAARLREELNAGAAAAQTEWRARLDADLTVARTRWDERVEKSLESAGQQAAERSAEHLRTAAEKLEQELAGRIAGLRQSFEKASAGAENTLHALQAALQEETARAQASLAEIQQAASRTEEFTRRLEALSQATSEELQKRFEAILTTQSDELNRRAESAVAGMAERLQPALEEAGQQSVERLATELKQQLAPHLDRAQEVLRELATGQQQAEEILRAHQERLLEACARSAQEAEQRLAPHLERARELAKQLTASQALAEETMHTHQERLLGASDQFVQETMARLKQSAGRFETDFQEAGRAAVSKWLAELEAKATETTHSTFETIYKSCEWYEKKAHTQMQAALEKGVEQAANSLREKAGEISGVFASELNHYSRNYAEHARGQMDEALRETRERARSEMARTAETTTAAFGADARRLVQHELEEFRSAVGGSLQETTERLEAQAGQVRSNMDAEARQFFVDFHKGMTEEIQQGVTAARQGLEVEAAAIKEDWRAEREGHQRQLEEHLARLSDESIAAYKKRLENASNSWLVTTVTTLTQQSQDAIGTLANSAEQRLRETCAQVFVGVGESLRQRLLDLSRSLGSPSLPAEDK